MADTRYRFRWRTAVAVLSAAAFLLSAQGSVTSALAADAPIPKPAEPPTSSPQTWETWPKKTVEPGVEKPPPTPETGAAAAGAAGGAKTSAGLSTGTIGLIVLGVGAAIGIGVAAGGGGGGSTTPPNH